MAAPKGAIPVDENELLPRGAVALPDLNAGPSYAQSVANPEEHTLAGFGRNLMTSGGQFFGGLGHAALHPIDTANAMMNLINGATVLPANRAIARLYGHNNPQTPEEGMVSNLARDYKTHYGSLPALGETIYQDPFRVASDVSMLAGGAGTALKGMGKASELAGLTRFASPLASAAQKVSAVGDVLNPATVPLKAAGALVRAPAVPLVKSALGLKGNEAADAARAALEETRGIRMGTISESAKQQLAGLRAKQGAIIGGATSPVSLAPARQVVENAIGGAEAGNEIPTHLFPMQEHLNIAHPGFPGTVLPAAEPLAPARLAELQSPADFLKMRQRFGKQFTKFDVGRPLTKEALQVGNEAYGALTGELHRAVPELLPVDTRLHNLIPVRQAAETLGKRPGMLDRTIGRLSARTGSLMAPLGGLYAGGLPAGGAVLAGQEALAEPAVRMLGGRFHYGLGTALGLPTIRRLMPLIHTSQEGQ